MRMIPLLLPALLVHAKFVVCLVVSVVIQKILACVVFAQHLSAKVDENLVHIRFMSILAKSSQPQVIK